jgi:hypothetical protein
MSAVLEFVGIDVAKGELVAAVRPGGEAWTVANDEAGIQELLRRLQLQPPALVVVEAWSSPDLTHTQISWQAGQPGVRDGSEGRAAPVQS